MNNIPAGCDSSILLRRDVVDVVSQLFECPRTGLKKSGNSVVRIDRDEGNISRETEELSVKGDSVLTVK
jgi:hypothetical protein